MWDELETLDQAIQCVKREQSSLRTECEAFREFRDTVSWVRPASSHGANTATDTTQLLEAYQEAVMSTPDFETVYGDSLTESLTAEFPPSTANTLLSEERITQQQKRDLLLATNRTIERRARFVERLETERKSLRTIREEISNIQATLQELPPCSIQCLSFEEYAEVWGIHDAQLERCNRLLQKRQVWITEIQQRTVNPENETHAFNEYLYKDLETAYPALRAIAGTRQCIERCCGETQAREQQTGREDGDNRTAITDSSSD
jgi:hypothetical protein